MHLTDYRPLGRSGLIVSPLTLGTMTFAKDRWGSDADQSQAIFNAYVDAGGNSIDTADVYSSGDSEVLTGRFIKERGLRDRVVISTKSGFAMGDHPHSGGAGKKHVTEALEASLKRLDTDYIDLYWTHIWDMVTPAEELLATMTALIQAGKIRYWAMSNYPAWYVAKVATLASVGRGTGPIALQFEYSLVERSIEAELLPAAREFGLGLMPWSPLAGGFLTAKYDRNDPAHQPNLRGSAMPDKQPDTGNSQQRLSGDNPFGSSKFTDRNWTILEALKEVAAEAGAKPAQVAMAWLSQRPTVSSILVGASRPEQLADNIAGLNVSLSADQSRRLDEASAPAHASPNSLFTPWLRRIVFGGAEVTPV